MEIEKSLCSSAPYDLKNSQFRLQNEGEVISVFQKSSSISVITILSEVGDLEYEVNSAYKPKVGTKVKVLYDKELEKYFIANINQSDDEILKEYFERLACEKFFYYNFLGLLAIISYLGFPLIASFYGYVSGSWGGLIFLFVIVVLLSFVTFLAVLICVKFARLMYDKSKKMYEDDES